MTSPAAHALTAEILHTLLPAVSHGRLRVTGVCMEPALAEGETVRVESVQARPPRFGDVVLAWQPDGLRLHRLVWCPRGRRAGWRMQADRARTWDPPLGAEAILATVAISRDRGRALRSLARTLAWRLRCAVGR